MGGRFGNDLERKRRPRCGGAVGEEAAVAESRAELAARIQWLERQLAEAKNQLAIIDHEGESSSPSQLSFRRDVVGSPPAQKEQLEKGSRQEPGRKAHLLQSVSSPVTARSTPEEKIRLFMDRSVGRQDVFASRWVSKTTGKQGWGPALRQKYKRNPGADDFLPFTASVVDAHLRGSGRQGIPENDWFHAGIYPMLPGDLCQLLVCDCDVKEWKEEASAYVKECAKAGIGALPEISRSGEGAHVWVFLDEPLSASQVRAAGTTLLRRAMSAQRTLSFASYDRFFPSQDTLARDQRSGARLGNLIALPLQGDCRRRDTTVFADPETWRTVADQFEALSAATTVSEEQISNLATEGQRFSVGPAHELPPRSSRAQLQKIAEDRKSEEIRLCANSVIHIPTERVPGSALTTLKHVASIANPEFFRRQASRISTFGIPRYVACFEQDDVELRIPRGLEDQARQVLEDVGFSVRVSRSRKKRQELDVAFTGALRTEQKKSVTQLAKHRTGVLVAPPGAGKTVIACALIARRKVPTAIIVNRRELLEQWRMRLQEFLNVEDKQIGQLGAGRRKRKGQIDLIMLQSLSSRTADPTVLEEHGLIVIDECHSVAAPAAEAALRQVNAPNWVGLTATPYRADRMDGLITMQCGPIRRKIEPEGVANRSLVVHETEFTTLETGTDGPSIQAIYSELAADEARNALIVEEVAAAVNSGRRCLVLTNRLDHLNRLTELTLEQTREQVISLHGRLSAPERRVIREQLADLTSRGDPFALVAMDKIAGEGLDLATLDTVFLAMPISFKGRVIQQLGRITRGEDEVEATAHDFADVNVPVLKNMHLRRTRVARKQGFTPVQAAKRAGS